MFWRIFVVRFLGYGLFIGAFFLLAFVYYQADRVSKTRNGSIIATQTSSLGGSALMEDVSVFGHQKSGDPYTFRAQALKRFIPKKKETAYADVNTLMHSHNPQDQKKFQSFLSIIGDVKIIRPHFSTFVGAQKSIFLASSSEAYYDKRSALFSLDDNVRLVIGDSYSGRFERLIYDPDRETFHSPSHLRLEGTSWELEAQSMVATSHFRFVVFRGVAGALHRVRDDSSFAPSSAPSEAVADKNPSSVYFSADKMSLDRETKQIFLQGSVHVRQDHSNLEASYMRIYYDDATPKESSNLHVSKILAWNKVHVRFGRSGEAWGDQASYIPSRSIVLSGNVVLKRGGNTLRGDILHINLVTNKTVLESTGKRGVSGVLTPDSAP